MRITIQTFDPTRGGWQSVGGIVRHIGKSIADRANVRLHKDHQLTDMTVSFVRVTNGKLTFVVTDEFPSSIAHDEIHIDQHMILCKVLDTVVQSAVDIADGRADTDAIDRAEYTFSDR